MQLTRVDIEAVHDTAMSLAKEINLCATTHVPLIFSSTLSNVSFIFQSRSEKWVRQNSVRVASAMTMFSRRLQTHMVLPVSSSTMLVVSRGVCFEICGVWVEEKLFSLVRHRSYSGHYFNSLHHLFRTLKYLHGLFLGTLIHDFSSLCSTDSTSHCRWNPMHIEPRKSMYSHLFLIEIMLFLCCADVHTVLQCNQMCAWKRWTLWLKTWSNL